MNRIPLEQMLEIVKGSRLYPKGIFFSKGEAVLFGQLLHTLRRGGEVLFEKMGKIIVIFKPYVSRDIYLSHIEDEIQPYFDLVLFNKRMTRLLHS